MDTSKLKDPAVATPRTVLLHAAEVIRKRGHCAPYATDNEGKVCVLVAIGIAAGSVPQKVHWEALDRFQKLTGSGGIYLTTVWNRHQTQASAIAALEKAAFEGE